MIRSACKALAAPSAKSWAGLSDGFNFRFGPRLDARDSHLTPGVGVAVDGKAKLGVVLDHGLNSSDCLIGIEFVQFLRCGEGVLYLAEVHNLPLGDFPPFGFHFVELAQRSLLHVFDVTHGNYSMYTERRREFRRRITPRDYDLIPAFAGR